MAIDREGRPNSLWLPEDAGDGYKMMLLAYRICAALDIFIYMHEFCFMALLDLIFVRETATELGVLYLMEP